MIHGSVSNDTWVCIKVCMARGTYSENAGPIQYNLSHPAGNFKPPSIPALCRLAAPGPGAEKKPRIDKWSFGRSRSRFRVFACWGRPPRTRTPQKSICTCWGRPFAFVRVAAARGDQKRPKTNTNKHERPNENVCVCGFSPAAWADFSSTKKLPN